MYLGIFGTQPPPGVQEHEFENATLLLRTLQRVNAAR
jgi:hypothetical protein